MGAVRSVRVCLEQRARCSVWSLIYSRSVTIGRAPQILLKCGAAFTQGTLSSPFTTLSNSSFKACGLRCQGTAHAIRDGLLPLAEIILQDT